MHRMGIGAVVFLVYSSPLLASGTLVLSADGLTVYDTVNGVTWLADANFASSNRFGLPLCSGSGSGVRICVNPGGSMNYQAAAVWVQAMNAANYLGREDWQLPTTPTIDKNCGKTGPTGESFGFGSTAGNMTFSFATGWQGANTLPNFLYLLPTIPGKIAGNLPASGTGLEVNP